MSFNFPKEIKHLHMKGSIWRRLIQLIIICSLLPFVVEAEEMSKLTDSVVIPFDRSSAYRLNDLEFFHGSHSKGDTNGDGLKEVLLSLLGEHKFHTLYLQNHPWAGWDTTLNNTKIFLGTDTTPLSNSSTECYTGIYDTGFFILSQACRDEVLASVITFRREIGTDSQR